MMNKYWSAWHLHGTVAEKLKIARIYIEIFAKLEDIKKEKD
jgi:hypothetical protein